MSSLRVSVTGRIRLRWKRFWCGGEGVARGPWRATYWNQTFSHQADTTLLLLLSWDKSTSCSWQSQIPSFAPLQVAIKRPPKLFQFVGKQEMRRPCTIHSPSFAMTDNFLCKSFKSWATVILKIGGGGDDPQLPKTWEVFVSRLFWVHFCPMYRGFQWILMSRVFRICRAKGGRGSKMPGYGQLSISPPL